MALRGGNRDLKDWTKEGLKEVTGPVDIKVFITPPCPYCAHVVKTANQFAVENENIRVAIIDVTLFPEFQERYNVLSTPKTVIDDEMELTGDLNEAELLAWVFKPGTPEGRIASRLQKGEAEAVAREALDDQSMPPILAKLAFDADFGLRIGAMVALEEVMALDPGAALPAIPTIIRYLDSREKRDRGDAAYLLGIIGDGSVLGELEPLLKEEDRFLRETAQEAMERIKARR
jgi:thiol-disulfide isomerase/thioredoxin